MKSFLKGIINASDSLCISFNEITRLIIMKMKMIVKLYFTNMFKKTKINKFSQQDDVFMYFSIMSFMQHFKVHQCRF